MPNRTIFQGSVGSININNAKKHYIHFEQNPYCMIVWVSSPLHIIPFPLGSKKDSNSSSAVVIIGSKRLATLQNKRTHALKLKNQQQL